MNNENNNEEVVVEEEVVEEVDLEFEEEEVVEENKPTKPTETLEARKARLTRQLAQTDKKLGLGEKKEVEETTTTTPSDLGETAFLIANGIKEADEKALARKLSKETGKGVEELLETTYFQTELKSLREMNTTDNATAKGGNRGNNASVDTVEYWIAKGELPTDTKLRQDVVNARMKKESSKGVFYNS